MYNNSLTVHDHQNWQLQNGGCRHNITQWSKRDQIRLFNFVGYNTDKEKLHLLFSIWTWAFQLTVTVEQGFPTYINRRLHTCQSGLKAGRMKQN